MKEKIIGFQKIANVDGEVEFTCFSEANRYGNFRNPPDLTNAKNEILEIMKRNNILILKATKFNLKE